ncbi:type I restriction-modification system subunit M N-terminal domain-containing protein [Celeribacter sp.]|uniref:type I restriction-modification system subunit M N-terminal domain-containing protein n=1 Tax=Celeribacter sp. TaxID=1890673 RepID=UPI003A90FD82
MSADIKSLGSFSSTFAELLRGNFKQSEYGKVIPPLIILRRRDCILTATNQHALNMAHSLQDDMEDNARDFFYPHSNQSTNLASTSKTNLARFPVTLPPPNEIRATLNVLWQSVSKLDRISERTNTSPPKIYCSA